VHASTAGGAGPSATEEVGKRRERVNKYAEFSLADDGYGAQFERGELGGPVAKKSRVRRRPVASRGLDGPRQRDKVVYPDASAVDPTDPATFGFCEIGRVLGAHGVQGQLKVLSDSDFGPERLCTAGMRYLKTPNRRAPREVALLSGVLAKTLKDGQGAVYIVRLDGVDDREDAHALKGCVLFARLEDTPDSVAPERDEFMVRQLVGCEVRLMPDGATVVGTVVGMVTAEEISGTAGLGNDLLDIEKLPPLDGSPPQRIYIPFVRALCPRVDVEGRVILIEPVPGLLDLVQPPDERDIFVRGLLPAAGETGGGGPK
jgi:16S rRNA processing protein RimM